MATKKKTYYTLVQMTDGLWCPEFGDYDRLVVVQELEDSIDFPKSRSLFRIIKTGDRQADIDDAVAELNERQNTNNDIALEQHRRRMDFLRRD